MSKASILIIDDHPKTAALYASTLEIYIGAEVIEKIDIDEALDYLESFEPDAIIVRAKIGERKTDKIIFDLIQKKNLKSKLFVFGSGELNMHQATLFPKEIEVKNVIATIAKELKITAKEMAQLDVGKFYPFKFSSLVAGLTLVCDIYIKNQQGDHTLFLPKENKLHNEIFNLLKLQNIHEIYVLATDRLKFMNSQLVYLVEFLAEDELNLKDRIFIANHAYKNVRDMALRMQISPEVVAMTETCIETIQSIVSKMPKLSELMQNISDASDKNFKQTLLISFICNHIISNIEWGTNEHKVKLTFVAFFHNITLDSNFVLINTQEKLDQANIPIKEKEYISKHALRSAKIVTLYKKIIPMGVDTIIKQHHGSRNGIGFSAAPQSISPLALIFLVADEWVTTIMSAEETGTIVSKDQLINIVRNKYKTLSFEKIINALEKIT